MKKKRIDTWNKNWFSHGTMKVFVNLGHLVWALRAVDSLQGVSLKRKHCRNKKPAVVPLVCAKQIIYWQISCSNKYFKMY